MADKFKQAKKYVSTAITQIESVEKNLLSARKVLLNSPYAHFQKDVEKALENVASVKNIWILNK